MWSVIALFILYIIVEFIYGGGFIADMKLCLKDILICSTTTVHFAKDPTTQTKKHCRKLSAVISANNQGNCELAQAGTHRTRSLDFADTNGCHTYYYAKMTQIESGAQNNQERRRYVL